MPLPKAKAGSSKKAKEAVVGKVMHKLAAEDPSMPQDQKVAIAMHQAKLSRKKK